MSILQFSRQKVDINALMKERDQLIDEVNPKMERLIKIDDIIKKQLSRGIKDA